MSSYLTEDEQVEALKKWWKENGKSVLSGLILGFGIIFGWQGWDRYQTSQGEHASMLYTTMENQFASGGDDQGTETAKRLIGEHSSSVYATFAAFQLAKVAYQKGEKASAKSHLQWALDNAPDEALAGVARLRLARVLIDMQEWDAAQTLVEGAGDLMPGEFARLQGDIAQHRGDLDGAREAYQRAILQGVENADLVRMKLVDLGDGEASS
ncbi:MAG: tetratricopeptide repeat protein [Gammaproteobacteria bacterium]|nr:tetratricopeptide repeat protein [Gammaproteobacteria bacterium]